MKIVAADSSDRLAAEIGDATVFFGFSFPEPLFGQARQLRWIHSASAGIEANLFPALVEALRAGTIAGAGLDVTTPAPLRNVVDKRLGYVAERSA